MSDTIKLPDLSCTNCLAREYLSSRMYNLIRSAQSKLRSKRHNGAPTITSKTQSNQGKHTKKRTMSQRIRMNRGANKLKFVAQLRKSCIRANRRHARLGINKPNNSLGGNNANSTNGAIGTFVRGYNLVHECII